MSFHVPEDQRVITGQFASTAMHGCNGLFLIRKKKLVYTCIVSDGRGWEHVSVSIRSEKGDQMIPVNRTPTWAEMCMIKDIFWDKEDTVLQYHPAETDYVNCHPHVLHLWRPTDQLIPVPDPAMVGPK